MISENTFTLSRFLIVHFLFVLAKQILRNPEGALLDTNSEQLCFCLEIYNLN